MSKLQFPISAKGGSASGGKFKAPSSKQIWSLGFVVLLVIGIWSLGFPAHAAGDNWPGSLIPQQCADTGDCNLCHMLTVFMNIARWIFVLGGGGALVMMIYGATRWVASGGVAEHVESGKNAIVAAIFGLIVILVAWQIVYFIIGTLTGSQERTIESTLLKSWYAPFECPVAKP